MFIISVDHTIYGSCHFLPFQNQNLENMKMMPGDIIILHMCTINDSQIMSDSWDMEHNRQNVLSFWTIFCLFTLLTTRKMKILREKKKEKKITWRYHHFTQVHWKSWSYATLFLRYKVWWMWFLFFSLGYFFPFTPETTWKIKI